MQVRLLAKTLFLGVRVCTKYSIYQRARLISYTIKCIVFGETYFYRRKAAPHGQNARSEGGKKMPPAQRRTLRWYRWCSFSREQRLRQTGETKCICDELQKHRIMRQEDAAAAQRRQRSQHPKWRATANRTGRHASINGGARLPAVQPHVDEPNGIASDSFVLSGLLPSALDSAQPTTGPT